MSAPPGITANPEIPGGTTEGRQALTGSQINLMITVAHKVMAESGVVIGPSKVSRIVRRFGQSIARHRMTFHEFLCNEANLTPAQRRTIVGHPEWQRVIAYLDPTGETAVNNVMRAVRRG